jgi:hypothetical protein
VKTANGFYVGDNNNRFSIDRFTDEQVNTFSKTLINCTDCNMGNGCKCSEKIVEQHTFKHDLGKAQPTLVPVQGILDVSEVRAYGIKKYNGADGWKKVEPSRYVDALYRHLLEMVGDMHSKDKESGLEHYKHVACNAMFLCELLKSYD